MNLIDLNTIIDTKNGTNPTIETYRELEFAYVFFNERLFNNKLPSCLITLQREKRTLGYHSHGRFVNSNGEKIDELALNPSYFGVRSIKQTLSTLVHEQAHALVDVLEIKTRKGYHCKKWGNIMKDIGLYPSNTGKFGGKETGQQMSHYIIKGGKFDKACDELISNSFKLSWFDRYPPCSPMDLDIPLPSSFLVTIVSIRPKVLPKPLIIDPIEDDVGKCVSGGNANDDVNLNVDNNECNGRDKPSIIQPATEMRKDNDNISTLVSDVVYSEKGKVVDENEENIIIEFLEDGLSGIDIDLLNKPSIENNSNRIKYRCPTCLVQVWGKPKLKIRCGEEICNDVLFTDV